MEQKRVKYIDLLKAILVLNMILAHTFQLILGMSIEPINSTNRIMIYINLTTFSGFLFCFGYSSYIAYLSKDKKEVILKLLRNIIRLLFAFYISGISYYIINTTRVNIFVISKIFLLLYIPGFSEFLASFMMLNLFTLIFFNFIKKVIENKKALMVCICISLILTFIPYQFFKHPWISLIIGTTETCFPILQYMSLFLMGMYCAKYKPKFELKTLLFTFLCFAIFEIGVCNNWEVVTRFPPKLLWIIGSYFFIYVYYYASIYICKKYEGNKILECINFIGRDTLIFLLISNIILFTVRKFTFYKNVSFIETISIYLLTINICYISAGIKYILVNQKKLKNTVNTF